MFTITRAWLHSCSTSKSGNSFTKAQLAILGIEWPPPKGWLEELVGHSLPLEQKLEFESFVGTAKTKMKHIRKRLQAEANKTSFINPSDDLVPPWDD